MNIRRATPFALLASAFLLVACENKITMENYNAITTGMTEREVEKIMGGKGEEQVISGVSIGSGGLTSTTSGTGKDKVYIWKKDNAGEITVTFRDGKVIDKGKSGL
ncbi:MAG: hypothetical protein IT435_04600 [Phycisphaerales bacterium]|nr:hypothetical protein [Phycisphaerales bacterium]